MNLFVFIVKPAAELPQNTNNSYVRCCRLLLGNPTHSLIPTTQLSKGMDCPCCFSCFIF